MQTISKIHKKNPVWRLKKRVTALKQIYSDASISMYHTRRLSDKELDKLHLAKQLHARIYLEKSFIDAEDLAANGTIHLKSDPHQNHSDYFIVIDKSHPEHILGTARQIKTVKGHDDLPILLQANINKKSRANILKVSPEHCIEISGLAKEKGVPTEAVLELYRSMWLYSFERNHKLWLMACDTKLYKRLKILFGSSIQRIGKRTSYKGGDIIPCVLDLSKSSLHLEKNLKSRHIIYGDIRRKVARNFLYDQKIS